METIKQLSQEIMEATNKANQHFTKSNAIIKQKLAKRCDLTNSELADLLIEYNSVKAMEDILNIKPIDIRQVSTDMAECYTKLENYLKSN